MPDFHKLEASIPVAPLSLIALDSAADLGKAVNRHLVDFRHNLHQDQDME